MRSKVSIAAVAGILCLAAILAFNWLQDNRLPNFKSSVELYVYPETSASDVLGVLKPEAKNYKSLSRTFEAKKVSEYLKPGHYVVSPGNPSVYVARMLNNGWQTPVRLTLSGSLRLKGEIASKLSRKMLVDSLSMRKVMLDPQVLSGLGFTPATVYALFIPDTYEIYWNSTPEEILARMKRAYDAFWTDENLKKAAALRLTPIQVSTLASIVCGESNHVPEMPKIAGVYLNRLKLGMPLQADPTIAFCFDYKPERILNKHLEVDSPYNTYKHAGLPPGPICSPTRESLEAVLNPDYGSPVCGGVGCNLYFCANPDFSLTHVFAKTLAQHNANAQAFQAELNRRAAAKRAAAKQ